TILYGNKRNRQELKVKVKKENNVLVVVINGNQESFAADVFEKDGQQSSLYAFLRNQGFNDHDEYTSIAGGIVATYHDVQNISTILRSNESTVKNLANRMRITDIIKEKKKEEEEEEITPPTPNVIEVENRYRERSPDNFDNEIELAKIELNVLLAIGHITEEDYQKAFAIYERINLVKSNAKVDPTTETEFVSREDIDFAKSVLDSGREKVNQKDIAAYRQQIVGQILTSSDEIKQTLLTPELTAIAIEAIEAQQGNKELSEEEKEKLEASKKSLLEHGKGLLENIEKLEGYYYTDITNAADEYDGYMHLCSVYEKAENTEGSSDLCSKVREKMDEYIKPYDEYYKIPNKENPRSTAIKLNDRIKKASELADSIQFNEETLGKELLETLGKYKFIKEYKDGEPVYEESLHTNSDGKLEVVPGSRLETVLKFSLNHSMMRQLGDFDRDITEESLVEETKENAFVTLFSFDNAEQTVLSGLREHPTKFTDPQYLTEFRQKLSQGQPMSISPIGFDLAIKRQAHNVETYSNRLSSQLGREHTQFLNSALLARVKKIDATSPYKDNVKFIMDKSTKRNLWGAGIGFGFPALSGYVFTKCTANSAMSAALEAAKQGISPGFATEIGIGGGSALVGAIAGAAITTATYFATKKVISLFKKQKYGWQDVKKEFRDPAFWGIVGAGALSGASVGFALSGCPSCATACGMGALASAGFARFIKPYRDMRLYGHNKKTATAMGLLNAVSVFAGGYIGRAAAMNGIEAQTDTVVADKETFDALKNGDSDKLAEGWVREDAQAGDEGAYIWDTENIRTYDASSVASAKDRVSQWVEPEMLDKLHQDALSKGLSEETFWRYMNNSILANKDGVPAEFGTNRAYDMTVQTGTDFETILPAQIKHSDNHFMYYKENMESLGITPEEREIMAGFIDWKSGTINADENTLSTMYKAENWLTEDGAINTSTKDLIHNNSGIKNAQYDLSSKELVAADPNSGAPKTFTSVHKGNTGFTDKIVDIFARFTKEVRTEPFAAFGVLLV
ncbi:MAG: hypothetical protein IKA03_00705, partial [Alphaproteobacteria bacterium]|nr:hypothetical protein [Alphaproteobacteria bacterium]